MISAASNFSQTATGLLMTMLLVSDSADPDSRQKYLGLGENDHYVTPQRLNPNPSPSPAGPIIMTIKGIDYKFQHRCCFGRSVAIFYSKKLALQLKDNSACLCQILSPPRSALCHAIDDPMFALKLLILGHGLTDLNPPFDSREIFHWFVFNYEKSLASIDWALKAKVSALCFGQVGGFYLTACLLGLVDPFEQFPATMNRFNAWKSLDKLPLSAHEALLDLTIRLSAIKGVTTNHFQGMDNSYRLRQAFWSAIRFYFQKECTRQLCDHFVRLYKKFPPQMQRAIAIYDIPRLGKLGGCQTVAYHLATAFLSTSGISEEDSARCRVSLWKLCGDIVVFKGVDFESDEVAEMLANYIDIDRIVETSGSSISWDDFPCLRPYGIVLAQKT
jgi:hypothetical protein